MEHIETRPTRFVWRLFAAGLLPFVVESTYDFFSRWPTYRFTTASDYAALAFSVLVGSAFVVTLPLRAPYRIFSLLIYIPVFCVLLFFYGFWFVGVVFHEWL